MSARPCAKSVHNVNGLGLGPESRFLDLRLLAACIAMSLEEEDERLAQGDTLVEKMVDEPLSKALDDRSLGARMGA